MEWAGDNESFGVAEAGGNFRVLPTQRPKVLPRLPRRHLGVNQRAPSDVKPTAHTNGDQVVANFFSCVHVGLQILGRCERTFLILGLCRNRGKRLSKTNDLAFTSPKILFSNIGSESRRIAQSVDGMVLKNDFADAGRDRDSDAPPAKASGSFRRPWRYEYAAYPILARPALGASLPERLSLLVPALL